MSIAERFEFFARRDRGSHADAKELTSAVDAFLAGGGQITSLDWAGREIGSFSEEPSGLSIPIPESAPAPAMRPEPEPVAPIPITVSAAEPSPAPLPAPEPPMVDTEAGLRKLMCELKSIRKAADEAGKRLDRIMRRVKA